MGCWLGTTGMRASFVPVLVMTVLCFSASRWLRCTQHSSLRLIVAVNGQISSAKENASAVLKKYFPQTQQCSSDWRHRYAQLHKAVVVGAAPPRYLVSVAVEKGTADRITGLVTQFYLAVLSRRALTMVTYDDLPPFESACNFPYFNFTHPHFLPDQVLDPIKTSIVGDPPTNWPHPFAASGPVNSSTYHILYLTDVSLDAPLQFLRSTNLSVFPPENSDVPYVLSSSNRGHTHYLMHNPYHRQELSSYGLRPETAFMCGWFTLCAPNTAVQALYRPYWDALNEPGVLHIGIQARLGDAVFKQQNQDTLGDAQLAVAAPYFECAEILEKAFATPGQKVIWFFMADALPLRVAAKRKYGAKLLTDTTTVTQHINCRKHNPESCNKAAMDLSIQHSLGNMLTFSLADFHILAKTSGFGRLGAWMSGKYDNLFEFDLSPTPDLSVVCNPAHPTSHEVSSRTWAHV